MMKKKNRLILDMSLKNGWTKQTTVRRGDALMVTRYGPVTDVRIGDLVTLRPGKIYRLLIEELRTTKKKKKKKKTGATA